MYLIEKIHKLTNGKLIVVLEGGYNLENLAEGSEQIVKGILNNVSEFS